MCPPIDLHGPSGERVSLTGTWETTEPLFRGGIYFLNQVGSCLWFAGGFPREADDEFGPLSYLTVVFRGRIADDFSIHGTWADLRHDHRPSGPGGELDLRIEFGGDGEPQLVYVDSVGEEFIDPGFPDADDMTWVKLSDGGTFPPPAEAP